jgi:hypothetical protein
MVFFFITTLGISVLGMIALLTVKRYELVTGKLLFAGARPKVGAFFQTTSRWGRQILPALAQRQIERAWRFSLTQTHRAAAYSVVTFEHALERVLSAVRERTGDVHTSGEPSAFLREVADHKKHLLYKKGLKKSPPRDTLPG